MALHENDNIKDLFGAKLKNFEADVPETIWPGIEQSLLELKDRENHSSKFTMRKILSLVAIFLGLFIIGGLVLLNNSSDYKNYKLNGLLNYKLLTPDKSINKISDDQLAQNRQIDTHVSLISYNGKSDTLKSAKFLNVSKIAKLPILYCEVKENKTDRTIVKTNIDQRQRYSNKSISPVILPVRTDADSKERFSLGIRGGSGLLAANDDKKGGLMPFTLKSHPEMATEQSFKDKVIDLKHDQPVSFGLMVSKQITPNLSIETGVTYTYLSSKFKTLNSKAIDEKISFHYLGVPFYLNYTFARWDKADFYVSAGAQIEKDIQGRYNSTLINEQGIASFPNGILQKKMTSGNGYTFTNSFESPNFSKSFVKKNIHQSHVQFSAHLSAGASYPVYRQIYVYGNIGGAYYIDANNIYPTIYSDKKLQLDLNLGLKLKL